MPRHEATSADKATFDFTLNIPGMSKDLEETLYSAHEKEKASNWHYLLKVTQYTIW